MELTPEQIARMNTNKAKAEELLRKKREEVGAQNIAIHCTFLDDCGERPCENKSVDKELYEAFQVQVCSVCKLQTDDFDLITKSDAVKSYLVTDDAMSTLKFKTRDNPHHAGWTPMKLYLRNHVRELCIKRFGSLAKLDEVKRQRETLRFEKNLNSTNDILTASTKELRDGLSKPAVSNAHPDIDDSLTTGDARSISNRFDAEDECGDKRKRPKASGAVSERQKKKKSALGHLVNIIRGNS